MPTQVFATALVPAKEAEGRKWRSSAPGPKQQLQGPLASVDFDHPELLALPLGTCPAGSTFRARATIVTPMTFHAGRCVCVRATPVKYCRGQPAGQGRPQAGRRCAVLLTTLLVPVLPS